MSKKSNEQAARELRAAAESQMALAAVPELVPDSTEALLHELHVHQIELEMQNEALQQAQVVMEESRDRYVDLYEFAPLGYFTLACPAATPVIGTVSYLAAGNVATLTLPVASPNLPANTVCSATISTAAKDTTGLALVSNFVWTFTTGLAADTLRPSVTLTVPATTVPSATAVATNTAITAAFTEDMAPASITGTSFTLTGPGATPVAGAVTYAVGSRVATFTPTAVLLAGTTYTATITTTATDIAGNTLAGNQAPLPAASNYIWTFTTGVTPSITRPRVSLTAPVTTIPGPTTGVPANTAITAIFTKDMDPTTITAASFNVTGPGTVAVVGTVTYAARTASFTPTAALATGTTYTATITTAATDIAGNALAGNQAPLPAASNYVWTFSTVAATPPANISVLSTNPLAAAAAVCPNASVNATFTLTGPGLTPVTAASVVLDVTTGRIATFTPLAALTAGVTYTATLKSGLTGIRDMAIPGNTMLLDYVWTFTVVPATGACLTPIALGAAAPFGGIGGNAGMTNQGILTVVNGDLATTAASTLFTGFHDLGGRIYTETPLNIGTVNGTIYSATAPPGSVPGAAAAAGLLAANTAYTSMQPAALPGGIDVSNIALCPSCGGAGIGAGELGGRTLPPGIYMSAPGTFAISNTNLTLDAQGNANAVWVFQMASSLTVGVAGPTGARSVLLVNGAQAKNVFWQVGSAATINGAGGGTMVGTIIASAGATFSTAGNTVLTTLNGRALGLNASVTLVNTIINVPAP